MYLAVDIGGTKYAVSSATVAIPGLVQKSCSVRLGSRDWGDFSLLENLKKLFDYRRPERPLESVIYGCYIYSKNQK